MSRTKAVLIVVLAPFVLIALFIAYLGLILVSMWTSAAMVGGYQTAELWLLVPLAALVGGTASLLLVRRRTSVSDRQFVVSTVMMIVLQALIVGTSRALAESATPVPPIPSGLSHADAISPVRVLWLVAWMQEGLIAVTFLVTSEMRSRAKALGAAGLLVLTAGCIPPATVTECNMPIYDEVVYPLLHGTTVISDTSSSGNHLSRTLRTAAEDSIEDRVETLALHYRRRGWPLERLGDAPHSSRNDEWALRISQADTHLDQQSSDVAIDFQRYKPECF